MKMTILLMNMTMLLMKKPNIYTFFTTKSFLYFKNLLSPPLSIMSPSKVLENDKPSGIKFVVSFIQSYVGNTVLKTYEHFPSTLSSAFDLATATRTINTENN